MKLKKMIKEFASTGNMTYREAKAHIYLAAAHELSQKMLNEKVNACTCTEKTSEKSS